MGKRKGKGDGPFIFLENVCGVIVCFFLIFNFLKKIINIFLAFFIILMC
jgi:hypothetical protein